ncbi:MAG: DUF2273 domain-containing protein [Firmicutes bacterium]|nr:DUF2273 domain-containing protein [Bacillota bacterium]
MEFLKEFLPKIIPYKGRILGSLVGLITGLLWAFLGFWKALAFIICIFLGFLLGKKIDQRGSIRNILNRVLPPND